MFNDLLKFLKLKLVIPKKKISYFLKNVIKNKKWNILLVRKKYYFKSFQYSSNILVYIYIYL